MLVPDDAAAPLEPFDVDAVRDVAGDPHEEDQDHADGEREAEIIVQRICPTATSAVNASGPISGSSSDLPNVMLRPESASMMKQVAVIQCTNRSNALKRTIVRPDRPLSIFDHAAP